MAVGGMVKTKRQGQVVLVVMDNPSTLNAMDEDLGPELAHILEGLAGDESVKAVVLTGAGHVFSAGGNLAKAQAYLEAHPGQGAAPVFRNYSKWVHRVLVALTSLPQPVICAVEGVASGAGLAWMLASDYVVVDEKARLVFGFLGVGLTAGAGISLTLPRLAGHKRATELLLLNRRFTPARALEMGLIDEMVPQGDVRSRALQVAAELAEGPREALAATKALLHQANRQGLYTMSEKERRAVMHCADQPEFRHRVQRFAKKKT